MTRPPGDESSRTLTTALRAWVDCIHERRVVGANDRIRDIVAALDEIDDLLADARDRSEGMPIENLVAELLRTIQTAAIAEDDP